MEFIKVFYLDSDAIVFSEQFAVSDWYCKPAILSALALCLEHESIGFKVVFLTCTKFGPRQFRPAISKSFPVQTLIRQDYKKDCPLLIIGFNDHVYDNVKD